EGGEEHHAVGYILGGVSQVLAAISLRVAEPVGENEGFAVLLEGLDIAARRRMDRHREKAELHEGLRERPGRAGRIVVSPAPMHTSRGVAAAGNIAWVIKDVH